MMKFLSKFTNLLIKALASVILIAGLAVSLNLQAHALFSAENKAAILSNTNLVKQLTDKIVSGKVMDESGNPLTAATVRTTDLSKFATTDTKGNFTIEIASSVDSLVFSHIGFREVTVFIPKNKILNVRLSPSVGKMEDVVVTGIYSRTKESFTGSATTYTAQEIKAVSNHNVIQSLKTLDPAFNLLENTQFGSDPNRLPDLEIRGKSSVVGLKEQFGEDPNQPLFILDGFETSLQTIMDLNIDRIASATILKDAASTAIYGAKAANGVVVIETKSPEKGKLRVSYNGSLDLAFADLNDYNLMNAAEKLDFELKSGRFNSNLATVQERWMYRYDRLSKDIKKGVDTYWLAEPLRTGVNHRNNIYVEGGDSDMRYGFGVSNRSVQGVMRNSSRDNLTGNIDLIYRKGKVSFMNKFAVEQMNNSNPVVSFSEYARSNPYYRKRNEFGGVDKWLENYPGYEEFKTPNPLWNDALNSYNKGKSLGFRNNFNLEYRPTSFLKFRAGIGINKTTSEAEVFTSPDATMFDEMDVLRRGSYRNSSTENMSMEGNFTVTYGRMIGDHLINAVLGSSINQNSAISKGFSAEGFPEGDFTTPAFSNSYLQNSKPSYTDSKRRNANFYFNGGYSFQNKYLVDVNLRSDGTSVFGSNRLFSTTWATGIAWNIHKENFFRKYQNLFSMFKIRGSVGNPGNQNFGSFNALTTYRFNNWMQNNFGTGLLVDAFGNPNLDWQRTLDKNIGLDLSLLYNRLHFTFDYYDKRTDPLLASVSTPSSIGTQNRLMNIGMQVDRGFSGTLKYSFLYKPRERINWTTSITFRHSKAYYDNIGNKLDQFNKENQTKSMLRYYNGGSPTALWSIRSKGIDPASGREIFINSAGENIFDYGAANEVEVGESRPVLEGVFGNTFFWKGFSANIYIRYSYGGDMFNSTLYSKVENISHEALLDNQDRRALYDRWQNVGDVSQYKNISLTDYTPISSRFVQKNNYISLESVRVGYDLTADWLKKFSLTSIRASAYMNDILRVSTIKNERGIDYPFARTVTMSLALNF